MRIVRLKARTIRLICVATTLVFAVWHMGCAPSKAKPQNVLFITVDTLRADHLGCYGYKGVATPNVDVLAREGVLFERAIAQVPLTWPSHAAIFTGTYPFHNGVQDFTGQPLSANFRTLAESFQAHGYATGAVVSAFVLDRSWGLARGFDYYYDTFPGRDFLQKDLGLVDRKAGESVDKAIAWLEGNSHRPFFFWLHLFDPHSPYDPPEPYRSQYREHPYDGEVAYVDSQLGRLFDWLKHRPQGLYENTVVVFLSDHGESLGEHGEQEHGFFIYDSTVRVPLIIKPSARNKLAPGRLPTAVESISVAPTVLELVGIQDPIQKQFQSQSLLLLMTTRKGDTARTAYSETFYPFSSFGWSPLRGLHDSRYQFIEAPVPELYDFVQDPKEKDNLAPQNRDLTARLRAQLKQIESRYAPPLPASNAPGPNTEALEKLRALGYLAYRAQTPGSAPPSKLGDPKEKVAQYQAILRATDAFRSGNFSAGRALLLKVRAAEPRLYLVPFLLGEAASREANWQTAEQEFRRALELNPNFDQAMMGLARALSFQGKTDAAQELLKRALDVNPRNFRAWFELARTQAKSNPSASATSLEKVLSIQPNFAPAVRDLGLLAMGQGRYADAATHLEKAIELGLAEPATYNFLGISYSRTNRLEQAVESYRRALAADPNLAQAHLNLGFAYERLNQPVLAKQEYQTACRLDRAVCKLIANR
ncbi:MAG: sulfatase-like hydrolase/transferase [Acidobacteria bacterium]|nr:sulfatase-like hydrolase/transferase [Acidobacteriota bacterium]